MRLVALLPLVVLARAAAAADPLDEVRRDLDGGHWARAARDLAYPPYAVLSRDPHLARTVCRKAADLAYAIARDHKEGGDLVAAIGAFAERALEASPGNADALAARGEARLLEARALRSALDDGARIGPEDGKSPAAFARAAEAFEESYGADAQDGGALGRWVLARIEQAWAMPEQRRAILDAAEEREKTLREKHASSPAAALARAALLFERARDDVGQASTRAEVEAVRALVREALARLATHTGPISADIELFTLHNDIVAFARENGKKLRIEADFLTSRWTRSCLFAEVPRSRLVFAKWVGGDQIFGCLVQWSRDGRSSRRFVMYQYKLSTEYTIGPRAIGGDNPKGLIQWQYDEDCAGFGRKTRNRPVSKGRLNRSIGTGYVYEIAGEDAHGQALAYRGYCFKAKEHPVSIVVWIEEIGGEGGMDPQGEAIIDSMRESP